MCGPRRGTCISIHARCGGRSRLLLVLVDKSPGDKSAGTNVLKCIRRVSRSWLDYVYLVKSNDYWSIINWPAREFVEFNRAY